MSEHDAPVTAAEEELWLKQCRIHRELEKCGWWLTAVPRLIRALREARAEVLRDGQNWQTVADMKNERIAALEADKRRLVEALRQIMLNEVMGTFSPTARLTDVLKHVGRTLAAIDSAGKAE